MSFVELTAPENAPTPVLVEVPHSGLTVPPELESELDTTPTAVLRDSDGPPDVLLLATGSEVTITVEAAGVLADDGVAARVVSMPCLEWFAEQPAAYREQVLPADVRARVTQAARRAMDRRHRARHNLQRRTGRDAQGRAAGTGASVYDKSGHVHDAGARDGL